MKNLKAMGAALCRAALCAVLMMNVGGCAEEAKSGAGFGNGAKVGNEAETRNEAETGSGAESVSQTDAAKDNNSEIEFAAPSLIDWNSAISQTILAENASHYSGEECTAEGHLILKQDVEPDTMTVYVLTMYGEYQFQNGNLVKNGGTGVIPVRMTFHYDGDGSWELTDYRNPEDGSRYVPSIQAMFPEELWEEAISPSEEVQEELKKQEQKQAKAYLEQLGRKAEIGDYRDFDYVLLTDAGVSVESSNGIMADHELSRYPGWIGTIERLEDGLRYEYRVEIDQAAGAVIFTRREMETGNVVESRKVPCTFQPQAELPQTQAELPQPQGPPQAQAGLQQAQADVLLTQAPPLTLQDSLSSTLAEFTVACGNYTWNYPDEQGQMVGVATCGTGPLDAGIEREKLAVPDYQGMKSVLYSVSMARMPDTFQIKEYPAAALGSSQAEPLWEGTAENTDFLELKKDRVYVITALWPEKNLEENGFYGQGEYVIVTD